MNATVLLTAVDIDIPGYRILRPIGEGGMASVFLAVQQSLDREVALKVMSPVLAANAEFASRFIVEGKITAKLQHPNLVTVYDIGSHNGVYYLAAEYIPGGTLKERITEGGLSVGEILDIASDIAQGLDFAHQKGFVHRDVKPGNVLFRLDGRVVLADFGIAKAMDGSNSSTVAGSSIGTPDYMSPEQARGESVDGRSDLYSLGTVLYEMLVGTPPYQAGDPFTVALMHVTHPVPELPSEYAWLQPMITGLMAKLPGERFNTGAAFVEALHKLMATAPEGINLQQSTPRKVGSGSARIGGSSATQQRTRVSLSQEGTKSSWFKPAAIGAAVLVVAVTVWQLYPREAPVSPNSATTKIDPGVVTANDPPAATGLSTSFPTQTAAEALAPAEVDNLLTQADAYLEIGTVKDPGKQLTFPEDDSALGLYRRVLAAQPDNARAKAGVAAIVSFFRSKSYELCKLELWAPCGVTARNGLAIDQGDETLIKLNAAAALGESGEKPTLPPEPAK
ncbi:MAG TPA: serine/threonine-protein kinase [Arenimonas sp.]|uniref:serine/threonine-protein kinase n=1 Tax=Arenimonas sp. TaxID=1872635 RepID=UPI002CC3F959|nr:serine/threonine-protein kinase [Arenimonas sp.]HMB57871.1 serine/threonine-protein kinase [Arenimonas sp.]